MRTVRRMLAVILCVMLACAAVMPASAEMGYYVIKNLLSTPEYESIYLGEPQSYTFQDISNGVVMLIYNTEDKAFYLMGQNQNDTGEITSWSGVELTTAARTIYALCGAWESLTAQMSEGVTLTIGLGKQNEYAWISGADEAAAFLKSIEAAATPAE